MYSSAQLLRWGRGGPSARRGAHGKVLYLLAPSPDGWFPGSTLQELPPPCLLNSSLVPVVGFWSPGHLLVLHTEARCLGMWLGDITHRVKGPEPGPQLSPTRVFKALGVARSQHLSPSKPLEAPP